MSFEIGKKYSGYDIPDILRPSKAEISYRGTEVLRILLAPGAASVAQLTVIGFTTAAFAAPVMIAYLPVGK